MALLVDSCLRKHLKLLVSSDTQILVDFCKLAIDYIKNGANIAKYNIAAQKLQTEVDVVENVVTGLVKLLVDASKYSISANDFAATVTGLGFTKEQCEILEQLYAAKQASIRSLLEKSDSSLPSYKDVAWRIEAQVGSRSVPTPTDVDTNVALDLQLEDGNGTRHSALQSDLPGLVHLTARLETALRESKTFHIRRMQRVLDQ